jgi:hypothetical protein
VFAHYNFEKGVLYVEDELAIARGNTQQLATQIAEKERTLWGSSKQHNGRPHPYLRVSDVDLRLMSDLSSMHGLIFIPTAKDNKEAAINALRLAVSKKELFIHPRCKTTIAHLKHGVWNRHRTSFERSGDFGHFDAIDAMIYLVRNVHKHRNPFPQFMNGESHATHLIRQSGKMSDVGQQLKRALTPKRRAYG